uniref:T9SS type A sorting domain-containing protein n=1 Tax=uncultured Polaribacter sp. TaxID=174711 RepID=UPI0032B21F3C
SNIEGSIYRVILYSTTGKILTKGSLSILNFPVFISNDVKSGDYTFNFSNVIITNIQNIDVSSLSLEDGSISISSNLSIEDETFNNSLKLYPNPVLNILTIESKNSIISKVEIYSILGQKIKEIHSGFRSIRTNNLTTGTYITRIYSEKGMVTRKIYKR